MRYRNNTVYNIATKNYDNGDSLKKLEELINSLIPSCENNANDIQKLNIEKEEEKNKIKNIEDLIEIQNISLEEFKKEKDEFIQLINEKMELIEQKIDSLNNKDAEIFLDELILFKEQQESFNIELTEKVDDRIDKINEFIDFINSLKERLDNLETQTSNKSNVNEIIDEVIEEEIENSKENSEELEKLRIEIQEKIDENNKLREMLSNLEETKNEEDDLKFNENWLKEFEEMKLSLEDDGIYEYEYEEAGEDMKFEFYNGELPKTKIVKVRANDFVKSYDREDINEFIGEEARRLASKEIDKLQSDSEMTQKAWLANNQKLNEMAAIIEKQEQEIKRLTSGNVQVEEQDISNLVKHEALKLIRDEYEERIKRLESRETISSDSSIDELRKELKAQREENERLRSLLNAEEIKEVVENKIEEIKVAATPNININVAQKRKRKQKFFFEIKEHNSPKITKADLEK